MTEIGESHEQIIAPKSGFHLKVKKQKNFFSVQCQTESNKFKFHKLDLVEYHALKQKDFKYSTQQSFVGPLKTQYGTSSGWQWRR
jgi:hypothetical protein